MRLRPPIRRAALGVLAAVGLVVAAVSASPSSAQPEEAGDRVEESEALTLSSDLSSALEESDFSSSAISMHNANKPSFGGVSGSPTGSRSNDVRVAGMNSDDVLVHSNESCAGPGGFEIYDVDDPSFLIPR